MERQVLHTDATNLVPITFDEFKLVEVMTYENSALVFRLREKLGLEEAAAQDLFADTKRFLFLCGAMQHSGRLAPPELIDEGWHNFVLFTEDYAEFCKRYFGKFIHHRPRRPEDPPGDGLSLKRTKLLAQQVFGGFPTSNWMFSSAHNADCGDAENCTPSTNCQSTPSDCSP